MAGAGLGLRMLLGERKEGVCVISGTGVFL